MRYRRISYRYTEVVGGFSGALEAEMWALLRPQTVSSPYFRPAADVVETPSAFHVTIEVPGVADEDMEVFVHPDALVVTGRRNCRAVEGGHYHAAEIRYGPFRFDMAMPPGADSERLDATTDRGVLRIVLPKKSPGDIA